MIVGIDAGNNEVKVMGPLGTMKFPSAIGAYRERNLTNAMTTHDMVVEYKGRKVFAGTLAEESDWGGSMMGDSKAHEDGLLRTLIALHRYSTSSHYEVVVGQPIGKHTEEEKRAIKSMLLDNHTVTINGDTRKFRITRAEVAAEGGAAFWSAPVDGLVRIIDVGSGTVNCATLKDRRFFDKGSFSIPNGINTVANADLEEFAWGIHREATAKKWRKDDTVLIVGGIAQRLVEAMRKYYPKADVIKPAVRVSDGFKLASPIYANAVGFYNIGRALYGEVN